MARRTKATQPEDKVEGPEKETPEALHAAVPLFDQSDVAVRKMIKAAKKRDYIAHEQINSVLPSEAATSEQIEDILAVLNEVGIHTVQSEEAEPEEEVEAHEEPEEEESEGGELVEVQRAAPAKGEKAKPSERTDDPVRMYLREMGSLEPLSRAGEIAIAKRDLGDTVAIDEIAGPCAPSTCSDNRSPPPVLRRRPISASRRAAHGRKRRSRRRGSVGNNGLCAHPGNSEDRVASSNRNAVSLAS